MLLLLCDVNSPNAESTEPSEGQKMACFLCCLAIAREGCRVLMLRIPRPVLPTTQTLCPVQPKMRDGPHAPKPIQVSQRVRHVGIRNFLWRWGSEQKVFVLSVTRLSTCCSSLCHALELSLPCPGRQNLVFGEISPPGKLFRNKSQEFRRHIFFTSGLWNLTHSFSNHFGEQGQMCIFLTVITSLTIPCL